MKLQIEITRQDYLDFNIHHFLKTKMLSTVTSALFGLFILIYFIYKSNSNVNLQGLVIAIVVYLILYAAILYFNLYKTKKVPKDKGAVLGKKELDFNDEVILYSDEDSNGEYKWTAIKSLDENKKSFYLYVDRNMAIVVPKRYFFSREQEQLFRILIQKKLPVA